jgi:hypothetical protein
MRKTVFAFVLLSLISVCHAQNKTRRDGNWWNTQGHDLKRFYMIGLFDGMQLGNYFSVWGIQSGDKTSEACEVKAIRSYQNHLDKYFTNVTNGQVADGLDTFYKDYRNRSILVPDAVWVVINSIAGKPQKDIDEMTENFRKSAD